MAWMMLKSPSMVRRYTIELLVLLALGAAVFPSVAQSQETDDSAGTGITAERVDSALDGLLAGGDYNYDEQTLDEPQWLISLRQWMDDLGQRWGGSPISFMKGGGISLFGYLLILILALLVLVFVLMRLLGGPSRLAIDGLGVERGADIAGTWSDSGAQKAVELASLGNFREAASMLFKSSLRGLDSLGWIRYRTSSASRQYLRQLRRSAELYPVFRDLLGRFEVAYYRKSMPDHTDWSYMYERYHSLVEVATSIKPPAYMTRGR